DVGAGGKLWSSGGLKASGYRRRRGAASCRRRFGRGGEIGFVRGIDRAVRRNQDAERLLRAPHGKPRFFDSRLVAGELLLRAKRVQPAANPALEALVRIVVVRLRVVAGAFVQLLDAPL